MDTPYGGDARKPDATVPAETPTRRAGLPRRGFGVVSPAVLAALVLAGAGTAFAFSVPVIAIKADRSLPEMLPATTALYISADLNPSGETRTNLDRIQHAFTDQPGWSRIVAEYKQTIQGQPNAGACYQQTQGQVASNLDRLGHTSAFAVLDVRGVGNGPTGLSALQRNMVFLAPVDTRLTLRDAMAGFHLSLPEKTMTYRGTAIEQETFPACARAGSGVPQTVYAALIKNWVAIGLRPDPIERIVDTGAGSASNLASVPLYRDLAARLPGNQLGGYFLNAGVLRTTGLLGTIQHLPGGQPVSGSNALQSSAGGLYAEPGGLRMIATATQAVPGRITQPAGAIASQIPGDALALLSFEGIAGAARAEVDSLTRNGLLGGRTEQARTAMTDLTAGLSGEMDLVMLRPHGTLTVTAGSVNAPGGLFWQVSDDAGAARYLANLAGILGLSGRLRVATAADGTVYHATPEGYGYAVRKGWAILSLQIAGTLERLSSVPAQSLASLPAYRTSLSGGISPGTIVYIDARGLREQLEASLLPTQSPAVRSQYEATGKELLAPLQSFSLSSGASADGRLATTQIFLGIGKP